MKRDTLRKYINNTLINNYETIHYLREKQETTELNNDEKINLARAEATIETLKEVNTICVERKRF